MIRIVVTLAVLPLLEGCTRHSKSERYYLVTVNVDLPYWKTAAEGFQKAATDSPKQWRTFFFVGVGGEVLFIPLILLMAGYWSHPPSLSEAEKLFTVFARTLQYSYLFGILPALMIGAVDDILFHVRRIGPLARMLIVGAIAFITAEFLYGSRGSDSGVIQFILYGLVGFIPATVSSWLAHEAIDEPAPASPEPAVKSE